MLYRNVCYTVILLENSENTCTNEQFYHTITQSFRWPYPLVHAHALATPNKTTLKPDSFNGTKRSNSFASLNRQNVVYDIDGNSAIICHKVSFAQKTFQNRKKVHNKARLAGGA